jgi:hypothetical protein
MNNVVPTSRRLNPWLTSSATRSSEGDNTSWSPERRGRPSRLTDDAAFDSEFGDAFDAGFEAGFGEILSDCLPGTQAPGV